ncbi:hypothetical protein EHE19_014225 [Ruminiclostridium herbifermentans]|uniref:DUF5050 domain-containing protein n=1 Tax=Ruminiclostridium herbifermentans TaxID=2488810 RepID=A0A4U7JHF2_9FIRM|nr:hypothetical protein [Ruminiclostridium herbifermentans]QNU66030.1 hypothetical protein EHE19_014225 [Ruminiclostridium herbifermentans]
MKYLKNKLILVYIMTLLITLSGCGGKQSTENTYIKDQDSQFMYFSQGSSPIMAEAENGYYFFSGSYLYYADKNTMKPVILCNKPNCIHDRENDPKKVYNCNAFFSNDASPFISYYNGNIYVISIILGSSNQQTELLKVSSDGTKRKSILKFDVKPMSLTIHRGKLYYEQAAYDKNQNSVYSIKEFNLNKFNAKPKTIYTGTLEGGHIQDLMCYGNNLYFLEFAHNENSFTDIHMRYDILTGKANRLYNDIDSDDLEFASYPSIHNGKIYYSVSKYNMDGTSQTKNSYVCNLDGSNKKEIFSIDKDSVFLSDQQYLYSNDIIWSADAKPKDQQKLRILDNNGKVINSIDTGYINDNSSVICGGDLHLFITTSTKDKFQIFYADKKQFTKTGKIEIKTFFEMDIDRMTPAIVTGNDLIIEN